MITSPAQAAVLDQLLSDFLEGAVELGMAKQRHIDAAADEEDAIDTVNELGHLLSGILTGDLEVRETPGNDPSAKFDKRTIN